MDLFLGHSLSQRAVNQVFIRARISTDKSEQWLAGVLLSHVQRVPNETNHVHVGGSAVLEARYVGTLCGWF